MDSELEVIRDEMEHTRASLADKLGALETQVRETVSGATEAVSSTVEGVRDVVGSVADTVGSVKETFNIQKQFDQHPWMAMGVAVAAGFVAAQVLNRVNVPAIAEKAAAAAGLPLHLQGQSEAAPRPAEPKQESSGLSGMLPSLEGMMPDMGGVMNSLMGDLGALAVGSLMGAIREMAAKGLPDEWKGEVNKLVDQVTNQLGGKPIDETRAGQLLGALGLSGDGGGLLASLGLGGEKSSSSQGQDNGARKQESDRGQAASGPRHEAAPYDPARPAGAPNYGTQAGVTGQHAAKSVTTSG